MTDRPQAGPRNGVGALTIVGTGYLVPEHLSAEARAAIEAADRLLYLAADVPSALEIRRLNPESESLGSSYRDGRPRAETYAEMAERILVPVREGRRVCAAFYGHPGVFVTPSHEAIRRAREEGFEARMLPAISAEDCLSADLGFDPALRGCATFEATEFLLKRRVADPTSALVLLQIGLIGVRTFEPGSLWSRHGLRVLAEVLSARYPAEHRAAIYEASAVPGHAARADWVPLSRLGEARVTIASTLFVPPAGTRPVDPEMRRRLATPGSEEAS